MPQLFSALRVLGRHTVMKSALVFGVRHESGFFSELKIGGSGSPNLRYGVGFAVGSGRTNP